MDLQEELHKRLFQQTVRNTIYNFIMKAKVNSEVERLTKENEELKRQYRKLTSINVEYRVKD